MEGSGFSELEGITRPEIKFSKEDLDHGLSILGDPSIDYLNSIKDRFLNSIKNSPIDANNLASERSPQKEETNLFTSEAWADDGWSVQGDEEQPGEGDTRFPSVLPIDDQGSVEDDSEYLTPPQAASSSKISPQGKDSRIIKKGKNPNKELHKSKDEKSDEKEVYDYLDAQSIDARNQVKKILNLYQEKEKHSQLALLYKAFSMGYHARTKVMMDTVQVNLDIVGKELKNHGEDISSLNKVVQDGADMIQGQMNHVLSSLSSFKKSMLDLDQLKHDIQHMHNPISFLEDTASKFKKIHADMKDIITLGRTSPDKDEESSRSEESREEEDYEDENEDRDDTSEYQETIQDFEESLIASNDQVFRTHTVDGEVDGVISHPQFPHRVFLNKVIGKLEEKGYGSLFLLKKPIYLMNFPKMTSMKQFIEAYHKLPDLS